MNWIRLIFLSFFSFISLNLFAANGWVGIVSGITEDALFLFDTATNTVTTTVPLSADSLAAVITPDGSRIYVANYDVASVSVIDTATNEIIDTILTTVGTGAFDIIVSPDGLKVYVSNNLSGFVTVIDTTTNSVLTNIFVSINLGPLSITPDGKTVYVGDVLFGNVTSIDTATNTIVTSFLTGASPGMISITPDGTTAYVANFLSDTVSIVDVATNMVTSTINFPVDAGPYGSFILPNGQTMYVANINNSTISVVDIATNMIVTTIPFPEGSEPFWIAGTPNGKTVYVTNAGTDDVIPIDVATNTLETTFANIAGEIQDIVISADQAPFARFTVRAAPANSPTTFDASESTTPVGTIVSYAWDFGDGFTTVTNTPIINHTYTTINLFNVTLTVTNSAGTSTSKVFSSRFMSNNGGPSAVFSTIISIGPAPPINLTGFQKECRFVIQSDIINVIRWQAPTSNPKPVSYRIYRDATLSDLLISIPATDPLEYQDHNRKKHKSYTYYIVSVSQQGTISSPDKIIIP